MSYNYAQNNIPDTAALLRENNSLRLTIDSLQEEVHALKSGSTNPFLETQFLSLKSENQQLLMEKTQLIKQLQSPGSFEQSPDKMSRIREQVDALIEENRKLNDIIIDLKQRNSQLESGSMPRQNSYYAVGDDDYNTLQGKVAILSVEADRLNKTLTGKDREIEALREAMGGSDSTKVTILELENRVLVLSAENERLNAVLNDRNREIETLQLKLSSYGEGRLNDYSASHERFEALIAEIEHLNGIIQEREREIDELRGVRRSGMSSQRTSARIGEKDKRSGRYESEENNPQARIKQLEAQLLEAEGRIRDVSRENNILIRELDELKVNNNKSSKERTIDLSREVEIWKERYRDALNESKQGEQYESEIRIQRNEIENLKTSLEQRNKQVEALQTKNRELGKLPEEKADIERKVAILVAENERVNTVLMEKKKEIEGLKSRLEGLGTIEEKITALVEENQRLMKSLNEKTSECESWKEKYASENDILGIPSRARGIEAERRIRNLEGENERVKTAYSEKLREIDTLKKRLKEGKEQMESWKSKFYEQDGAFLRNSQMSNQLEGKLNRLKQENARLTSLLEEKVKQNTDLQVKLYTVVELEGKVKSLAAENERLDSQVERQRAEIVEMSDKSIRLEIIELKFKEMERHMGTLVRENEELKNIVREKDNDMEGIRTTLGDLEGTSIKVYKLEEMLEVLVVENERTSMEAEDRRREVQEWKEKVRDLQGRNMKVAELETRIELLAAENERMAEAVKKKERMLTEIQETEGNVNQMEQIRELEETIRWLAEENERLKEEIRQKERASIIEAGTRGRGDAHIGDLQARLAVLETENVGLRQVLNDREEEIKQWRLKYENKMKQIEGERELQERLRSLQNENDDLRGNVIGKNAEIGEIVKKNRLLEDQTEKGEKVKMEKVLICAEVERLWEEVIALRKEKALLERKDLAMSRSSYRSGMQASPEKYEYNDEGRNEELEEMVDELSKENVRLEGLLMDKERELEYYREKGLEYERAGTQVGTLEGKLDIVTREKEILNDKVKEYKEQIERLTESLRMKDNELARVSARLASKDGPGSGDSELEYQLEASQREIDTLTKANEKYLKDIEVWKGKHLALEQGYFRIGELEVRNEELVKEATKLKEEVDLWRKKYMSLKKDSPGTMDIAELKYGTLEKSLEDTNHIGLDKSKDNFSGIERLEEYDRDRFYGGMSNDSFKILQDSNVENLKKTLERREKELRAIRGEDALMSETLSLLGRSPDWEVKEERGYDYTQGTYSS